MGLCLQCGKIGEHAKGCPSGPADAADTSPPAKNARALKALETAQARLKELRPLAESSPRDAAKGVFALELLLEKSPSSDLSSFEHKRQFKAAEDELKKVKAEASGGLDGKADQLFADLAFAKKAVELLHAAQVRRREVAGLELDELTRIAGLGFDPKEASDPTDPAAVVRAACDALDKRLATTSNVDDEAEAWGKNYLEPLAAGEAPRELPAKMTGSAAMPAAVLGAGVLVAIGGAVLEVTAKLLEASLGLVIVGVVVALVGAVLLAKAQGKRKSAPAEFAALSQRFRDRLYLASVLRSLRGILSNLSKAEEALRTHTGGTENAARWKRIKTQERDIVKAVAGDWDDTRPVDDEMQKRIASTGVTPRENIRSIRELAKDEWDGLAKAYWTQRAEDAQPSDEARLATLAEVVLGEASQKPEAIAARKKAIGDARNAFAGRGTTRLGKSGG